jgi:two-component system, LytTR family, sensor kinase
VRQTRINKTEIIMWVVGVGFMILMNTNLKTGEINWIWTVAVGVSAWIISELQGYMVPRVMQRVSKWSVQKTLGIYALLSVTVALVVGSTTVFIVGLIEDKDFTLRTYISSGMIYIIMTFAFTSVPMITAIVNNWKGSLLQEQQLKEALLTAEYDTLKNQVNPHFLFNSLNILSALIPEDPLSAVGMVERMSKVFRYNLQNKDRVTVEVATELKIVEAYLFINKMRFGDNLQYQVAPLGELTTKQIVTQGLLTLVENAIKHNECSSEKPLHIHIAADSEGVLVKNNYQPKNKQFLESTGIGLSNLKSRYQLLTSKRVKITEDAAFFEVWIPFV